MKGDPETLAEFSGTCKTIKEKLKINGFSFRPVTESEVTSVILNLPTNKGRVSNDIRISRLKQSVHVYYPKLTKIVSFWTTLQKTMFSDIINLEIIPFRIKDDKRNKEIYKPTSIAGIWNQRFSDFY